MTGQQVTALALVAVLCAYLALILYLGSRRRRARNFAVRQALMREQAARRRPGPPPVDAPGPDAAGSLSSVGD